MFYMQLYSDEHLKAEIILCFQALLLFIEFCSVVTQGFHMCEKNGNNWWAFVDLTVFYNLHYKKKKEGK